MRRLLAPAAVAGLVGMAVAVPYVVSPYMLNVLVIALVWGFAASAWNVAGGFAGQLSLGHGLYFGVGAYSVASLYVHLDVSPLLGVLVGATLSAAVALAVAYVSYRTNLGHLAFAILTLALSLVGLQIVASWDLMGRQAGLFLPVGRSEPANLLFSSTRSYYALALVMVVVAVVFQRWLLETRAGQYWVALRDNEEAAVAVGVDALFHRMASNAVSAAMTAVGGALYLMVVTFIDPASVFGLDVTINLILFAVVGGLGTVSGPLVGAGLLVVVAEFIRTGVGVTSNGVNEVVFGAAIVITVLLLPAGLVSLRHRIDASAVFNRLRRAGGPGASQ